ncbi:hypothetical protein FC86_GL000840 [Holzapfeliella floricola DSM 23037 = JCM 16512]|uniref:Uncharacterized protein n=2 Tax=Holzapfeliella TaxID=2767883 RepID=A0A0R2DI06_9LACO|nr:hypothetical protein FC86_GL000840 [Holzapfeliella floricola DSM 23037 = JCM 16512]
MLLTEYINNKTITIDTFKKDKRYAIRYDFLKESIRPDNSKLIRAINATLFSWYDSKIHTGDSMNTYRMAIKYFYKKSFTNLDRECQLKIIKIIRQKGQYNDNHLFEFDDINDKSKRYICNNYQLGNFIFFPSTFKVCDCKEKCICSYKINPCRSYNPYNDFFDKFLKELKRFYQNTLPSKTNLQKATHRANSFFNYFNNFEDYINKNFLNDYLDKRGNIIALSEKKNFEEYVEAASSIIQARGRKMLSCLE